VRFDERLSNRGNAGAGYAVQTVVNGGSELLIFVLQARGRLGQKVCFISACR
jgi:hypothetical protein